MKDKYYVIQKLFKEGCVFCGNHEVKIKDVIDDNDSFKRCEVYCEKCKERRYIEKL